MHPTLLIGPYDWDSQHLPESEFRERIKAFWENMPDSTISSAIVYGDSRNHAELMYLSNFLPKLGPALLLVPRNGEPTLLVSGAPNMLSAARRMTWVEKTQPLGDPAKAIQFWLRDLAGTNAKRTALVASEFMRGALYKLLSEAFAPDNSPIDATAALRALMRRKCPIELKLIRESCSILTTATEALAKTKASGASVTAAILAAEHAARRAGAQDVRTLFSCDAGRTLRPFEQFVDNLVDPLQVYLAVRHAGYWTEGFVYLADSPQEISARIISALRAAITGARTGMRCSELVRLLEEAVQPFAAHPMTAQSAGNSIGLSLVEEPRISRDSGEEVEPGCVYSIRAGASDRRAQHAIVSAIIYVQRNGTELLWSSVA